MTNTGATLAQAFAFHQQGRLQEAITLYQRVLQSDPRNSDALHLLGLLLATVGQPEKAVILLTDAVQIQPSNPAIQTNLGSALSALGRHAEALACYDRAIALQPNLAVAYRGRAVAQLHLGKIPAAIASFNTAVHLAPADDVALNGLGAALEQGGRLQEARHSFNQAVALNPGNVDAHHNLGLLEAAAGHPAEALTHIERALALQPNNPVLRGNLAIQLLALGRAAEALEQLERAIAIQPNDPTANHNRGLALMSLGRHAEARAGFERAVQLAPDLAPAHLWRGKACLKLDLPTEALASFDRSLAVAPEVFDAHFQRGIALAMLDRHAESIASFARAIGLDANSAEAVNNRGAVLLRMFRPTEALTDFAYAIQLNPNYADAHTNAGITQRGLERYDDAVRSLDRALSMKPDDVTALWTQAVVKLAKGDFRAGLPLYESRLRRDPTGQSQRTIDAPRWSGAEPLQGKILFVHAEQGLGDTLQFCRYIPVLEAMGASVVFEVQPVLKRLLGSLGMRGNMIGRGESLPKFDLHIPLLSLPLAMGTELNTIPGGVPYLHVEPGALRSWSARLAALPGLKIGLNWHGNPEAERFSALQARSFPLAAAAPLARLEGVSIVSLQKGDGAEQLGQVEFANRVAQLTDPQYMGADEIATETAAILKSLDLVITADTALAHLAGALGVRVWLVLQAAPDWRWLIDRDDSPWYPTIRLFRQRRLGNWPEVFDRMAAELAAQK